MKREELFSLWADIRRELESVLPEVGALMGAKFAQSDATDPDSALAQNGLRDGIAIVADFISYNELGLALEHLHYMVMEAELSLSAQTYAVLSAAGKNADARMYL